MKTKKPRFIKSGFELTQDGDTNELHVIIGFKTKNRKIAMKNVERLVNILVDHIDFKNFKNIVGDPISGDYRGFDYFFRKTSTKKLRVKDGV